MKSIKLFFLGFAATILTTSFMATSLFAKDNNKTNNETRLESLAKFSKALGIIEQYYVDDLTINEIVKKSIEGLLTNLDAHSAYLDEKSFKDLKVQTEGEFGGLGITIGMKDGAVTIIAPIEDTPADKAGLKSGDIILKIDDKSTIGMTLDDAVSLMRGEPKTKTTITVVRKGENRPLTFDIIRDIIKVDSVYSRTIVGEDILYIRVTNFDKNVAEKTEEAFKKHKDIKGIILDIRNNPGGLLGQAVELTDLFVDEGVIVSQKGRDPKDDQEYKAKKGVISDASMVVLVNGGSASASEIVSGALQDLKRAIVIGENTFGKGSVQQIIPISDTEAIRMTIARYYLPSGRTIQALGVTPDITVYSGEVPHNENEFSVKEVDLKKHLEGELVKVANNETVKVQTNTNATQQSVKKETISQEDLFKDLQLKSAVDIIKVLNITAKQQKE
ncbi:MAG: S41 family peptidase [Campylobacteraceae bacterium]|jgi:carboxyl-terminal processing protease|nr:S41 family peptidase [Campylobacteraceae bacterium]